MCSSLVATRLPRCTCTTRDGDIETGARAERSLRVACRDYSARCSEDRRERQVWFDLVTFGAGAYRGHAYHDCKFRQ